MGEGEGGDEGGGQGGRGEEEEGGGRGGGGEDKNERHFGEMFFLSLVAQGNAGSHLTHGGQFALLRSFQGKRTILDSSCGSPPGVLTFTMPS